MESSVYDLALVFTKSARCQGLPRPLPIKPVESESVAEKESLLDVS
jgi:hypothetical protein